MNFVVVAAATLLATVAPISGPASSVDDTWRTGELAPVNALRVERGFTPADLDDVTQPVACAWAVELAGGAELGVDPDVARRLDDTIGNRWVRARELAAVGSDSDDVWAQMASDTEFVAAATDGGNNRITVCFEEGSAGTAGVALFVADRALSSTEAAELPNEPLDSTVFTFQVIGVLSALVISAATLIFAGRRR